MRLSTGITFVALLAPTPLAFAIDEVEAAMSTPPVMLGQVVLGLLFVVAVILLLAWVLKKLGHGGGSYSKSMRVVATLPLGTREKAALVQVGEQQFLLGVTPGRVNCLHVFDEPVITESSRAEHLASTADAAKKFKEILKQKMGRP